MRQSEMAIYYEKNDKLNRGVDTFNPSNTGLIFTAPTTINRMEVSYVDNWNIVDTKRGDELIQINNEILNKLTTLEQELQQRLCDHSIVDKIRSLKETNQPKRTTIIDLISKLKTLGDGASSIDKIGDLINSTKEVLIALL